MIAPPDQRKADPRAYLRDWSLTARDEQLVPGGDWWRIWLIMAGRGWGKTRTGCEAIKDYGLRYPGVRVAVVSPTLGSARLDVGEGISGLVTVMPPNEIEKWNKSTLELTLKNGSYYRFFSSGEPDRLRGPQFHWALLDEMAAWQNQQAVWDMLRLCVRLPGPESGKRIIATTPRPQPLLKRLLKRAGRDVYVTRGHTYDNAANLDPDFLLELRSDYENTRLGRQELAAEIVDDVPGALWTRSQILYDSVPPGVRLARVAVGVDPMGSFNGDVSDIDESKRYVPEVGIVTCGKAVGGAMGWVLDDRSGHLPPEKWARRTLAAYDEFDADVIAAERNFGGDMVETTIRAVRKNVNVHMVSASRSKSVRAQPVQALYAQNVRAEDDRRIQIFHSHPFPKLEDQMVNWVPEEGSSPDRMDALVWALHELFLLEEDNKARMPGGMARRASGGWSRGRRV